jgi:hypothetical protein
MKWNKTGRETDKNKNKNKNKQHPPSKKNTLIEKFMGEVGGREKSLLPLLKARIAK